MSKGEPQFGYRRLIIAGVAALVLVAFLVIFLDRQELASLASRARWDLVPLAVFFAMISYTSLAFSFMVVYRVFTQKLPAKDLLKIGFVSVVLSNMVFFGGVPEYTLRGLLMKPRGLTIAQILVPSALHSYIKDGIYLMGTPVAVSFMLAANLLPAGYGVSLGSGAAVLIVVVALVSTVVFFSSIRIRALRMAIRVWHFFTHRDASRFVDSFNNTANEGLYSLRHSSSTILVILGLVLVDWFGTLVALYVCFRIIGLSVGPGVLILGYLTGRTAGAVSFTPGGAGVQEASMAGIYSLLGEPFSSVLIAAVLFRLVYYFIPFGISLAFYRNLVHVAIKELKQDDSKNK